MHAARSCDDVTYVLPRIATHTRTPTHAHVRNRRGGRAHAKTAQITVAHTACGAQPPSEGSVRRHRVDVEPEQRGWHGREGGAAEDGEKPPFRGLRKAAWSILRSGGRAGSAHAKFEFSAAGARVRGPRPKGATRVGRRVPHRFLLRTEREAGGKGKGRIGPGPGLLRRPPRRPHVRGSLPPFARAPRPGSGAFVSCGAVEGGRRVRAVMFWRRRRKVLGMSELLRRTCR